MVKCIWIRYSKYNSIVRMKKGLNRNSTERTATSQVTAETQVDVSLLLGLDGEAKSSVSV